VAAAASLQAAVIDIHCHVLPGLDDGPSNMDFSLAMARRASKTGVQVMVATPHVRSDYENDPNEIDEATAAVNHALAESDLALEVVAGAELSFEKAAELPDETLRRLCLGESAHLLVEAPYTRTDVDLEGIVGDIQERGYRPVLAHPERSRVFQNAPDRLTRLVDNGVLCSLTAGSLSGMFGAPVRSFALQLMQRRLVHDVASDAHDPIHRPPDLLAGFRHAEADMPGVSDFASWFTVTAPVAILAGKDLPDRPDLPPLRSGGSFWRRLIGRA
jgi:protein-tyrosine phosphatase